MAAVTGYLKRPPQVDVTIWHSTIIWGSGVIVYIIWTHFLRRIRICNQNFEIPCVASTILKIVWVHFSKMGIYPHSTCYPTLIFEGNPNLKFVWSYLACSTYYNGISKNSHQIMWNSKFQPAIRVQFWSRFRIWSSFHIWSGSHDIVNILTILKMATKWTLIVSGPIFQGESISGLRNLRFHH